MGDLIRSHIMVKVTTLVVVTGLVYEIWSCFLISSRVSARI